MNDDKIMAKFWLKGRGPVWRTKEELSALTGLTDRGVSHRLRGLKSNGLLMSERVGMGDETITVYKPTPRGAQIAENLRMNGGAA